MKEARGQYPPCGSCDKPELMPQNEEALRYWEDIAGMMKPVGMGGVIDLSNMIRLAFDLDPPIEQPCLCAKKIMLLAGVFIKTDQK